MDKFKIIRDYLSLNGVGIKDSDRINRAVKMMDVLMNEDESSEGLLTCSQQRVWNHFYTNHLYSVAHSLSNLLDDIIEPYFQEGPDLEYRNYKISREGDTLVIKYAGERAIEKDVKEWLEDRLIHPPEIRIERNDSVVGNETYVKFSCDLG